METIIADNTHLTGRCQAMLIQLQSEAAKPLEPTCDELHPRPGPEREYRLELGDEIFLGTQKFELVGIYETEVALFDPSFPLLTKTIPRKEFDAKFRENPLNLQPVNVTGNVYLYSCYGSLEDSAGRSTAQAFAGLTGAPVISSDGQVGTSIFGHAWPMNEIPWTITMP